MTDALALSLLLEQLGYPTPLPAVRERLRSSARRPDSLILVAESGGQVMGFLALHRLDILPYPAPLARITAFCVAEGHRGQGVGGALERTAAAVACGWGCGKMEVTSNIRRENAHRFYERLGYVEYRKHYYKPLAETGRAK